MKTGKNQLMTTAVWVCFIFYVIIAALISYQVILTQRVIVHTQNAMAEIVINRDTVYQNQELMRQNHKLIQQFLQEMREFRAFEERWREEENRFIEAVGKSAEQNEGASDE
jgi:biopolymer transport protein ExbB/TolQ